jgi:hypothetical protein
MSVTHVYFDASQPKAAEAAQRISGTFESAAQIQPMRPSMRRWVAAAGSRPLLVVVLGASFRRLR